MRTDRKGERTSLRILAVELNKQDHDYKEAPLIKQNLKASEAQVNSIQETKQMGDCSH